MAECGSSQRRALLVSCSKREVVGANSEGERATGTGRAADRRFIDLAERLRRVSLTGGGSTKERSVVLISKQDPVGSGRLSFGRGVLLPGAAHSSRNTVTLLVIWTVLLCCEGGRDTSDLERIWGAPVRPSLRQRSQEQRGLARLSSSPDAQNDHGQEQ